MGGAHPELHWVWVERRANRTKHIGMRAGVSCAWGLALFCPCTKPAQNMLTSEDDLQGGLDLRQASGRRIRSETDTTLTNGAFLPPLTAESVSTMHTKAAERWSRGGRKSLRHDRPLRSPEGFYGLAVDFTRIEPASTAVILLVI